MYILYSRATATTGRLLRNGLGIDGGLRPPANRVGTLIRWGSTDQVRYRPGTTLNKRNALLLATDKLAALRRMQERGVPTPNVYTDPHTIPVHAFPVLGRAATHRQGSDIVLCMQRRDLARALAAGCTHFSEYIPTTAEFRVHIFQGETLKLSEKVWTEGENYTPYIRNFEHGHTFRNSRTVTPTGQRLVEVYAAAAVEALGLDFGAVDVLVGDDGYVRVLEVNTGPSLAENSLQVYGDKLASILGVTFTPPVEVEEIEDTDDAEEFADD